MNGKFDDFNEKHKMQFFLVIYNCVIYIVVMYVVGFCKRLRGATSTSTPLNELHVK